MTLDELVSEYEDIWRDAALRGLGQVNVSDIMYPMGGCAWLQAPAREQNLAKNLKIDWVCPLCSLRQQAASNFALARVMIHLNDDHKWGWLTLANKFRSMLQEGMPKTTYSQFQQETTNA